MNGMRQRRCDIAHVNNAQRMRPRNAGSHEEKRRAQIRKLRKFAASQIRYLRAVRISRRHVVRPHAVHGNQHEQRRLWSILRGCGNKENCR